MRFWGIEPKVSLAAGPCALLAVYLDSRFEPGCSCPVFGVILLALGIVLWLICYLQVSKAYAKGMLLTKGCYSRVRHPIYAIWGFLILPGFSLVVGGFMLLLPVIYWLSVLAFIGEEEKELEGRFGEEWKGYARRTGRFLPRRAGC